MSGKDDSILHYHEYSRAACMLPLISYLETETILDVLEHAHGVRRFGG